MNGLQAKRGRPATQAAAGEASGAEAAPKMRRPVGWLSDAVARVWQDGKPVQLALFDDLPAYVGPVSKHPLYRVWVGMKRRCSKPARPEFKNYGRRGIVVCEEWRASSRAFVAWALANGWQPGLQIDRRDNDGPYSPENCRFVTRSENNLNRRDTVRLAGGYAALPVAAANGISREAFCSRLERGWPPDRAATLPPMPLWRLYLADGTPLSVAIRVSGISENTVRARIARDWSADDAVSIPPGGKRPAATAQAVAPAPSPQRRQNGAGRAQPASDVGRGRKSRKAAPAPAPGRCGETGQLQRGAK